jgi:hypothetical protein
VPFDLPPVAGPARDKAILTHIEAGDFEAPFATITSTWNGHTADFYVFADALKIAGVRINVSAYLEQQIADLLSCSLMTAKVADLRWAQRAVTLPPYPRPIANSTAVMVNQSSVIDVALSATGYQTGIVETTGKNWLIDTLLDKHPGRAINYGWHFDGTFQGKTWDQSVTGSARVIQGRGWAHDSAEVDYSQVCILVSRTCVIDGTEKFDLWELLRDSGLAPLASAQGVLKTMRQPGVPVLGPLVSINDPTGPTPVYA